MVRWEMVASEACSMSGEPRTSQLGAILRARRREKRLSLRDLAAGIGVSMNTLSRVERGQVPDLKNFQRIADWLDMPTESLLYPTRDPSPTPEIIARHLRSDRRLPTEAAREIARLVEDMYYQLVRGATPVSVHLRSAKTFTPAAGALLSEILHDIQSALQEQSQD